MLLKIVLIIVMIYSLNIAQVKIEQSNDATLEYGKLSVSVDPKAGGRIVSLQYDGKEFLTDKTIHENNYGSTLWPSPQALWNWPPPAILDSEEYDIQTDNKSVTLKSKEDFSLGLQFFKTLSLSESDTSVVINYKIKNISDKDIEAAPWEITRMPKGGTVCFPKGETAAKAKSFDPIPYTESDGIYWYKNDKDEVLRNHLLSVADGSDGWLAYIIDSYLFLKRFDDVPVDRQFDNEGEIAIYVNPASAYVEIEAQGPKKIIQPGASMEWNMKWIIRKLPVEIKKDKQNDQVISFINKLISN